MVAGKTLMISGFKIDGGKKIMDYDAKKELGQHWLNDPDVLAYIVDLAELKKKDLVLEIGPGKGSLTNYLAPKVAKVIAVEIDPQLMKGLKEKVKSNVEIINQDIRYFNFDSLPENYKVIANIPYYLTSFLIRLLSEANNSPERCVLMVQKEVAERISEGPGKMSILSITAQVYWRVSLGAVVPAKLFNPPPKTDSMLIRFDRLSQPLVPDDLRKEFFRTLRIGFSQKRKQLVNSIASGYRVERNVAEEFLKSSGISPTQRPQQLSIDQWLKLTENIVKKTQ